jgi:hypothetical protein
MRSIPAGLRQRQRSPRLDRSLPGLLQSRITTPICLCREGPGLGSPGRRSSAPLVLRDLRGRKIHGPSGSGWTASISPLSAASRSVFWLMPRNSAARVRFSRFDAVRGGAPHRNAMVGAQRCHTLAAPAIAVASEELVAVGMPTMRSSLAMRTSSRTAAMISGEVLLRWPRRRRGKRISVWMPPASWRANWRRARTRRSVASPTSSRRSPPTTRRHPRACRIRHPPSPPWQAIWRPSGPPDRRRAAQKAHRADCHPVADINVNAAEVILVVHWMPPCRTPA